MGRYINASAFGHIVLFFSIIGVNADANPSQSEYGVDRSNLTWEPVAIEEKALEMIAALKVRWFRDSLSGVSPESNAAFVAELRIAKAHALKFLAIVGPNLSDFQPGYKSPNSGAHFSKRCGWDSGSLEISKIDLNRFKARLRAQLDAVKNARLSIDAFEIGNELDWICFNGDVPDGHRASKSEVKRLVKGYAKFLEAAATTIQAEAYFPDATIITFGVAHVPEKFDVDHHISNPDEIIQALRNLDGVDYINSKHYRISGVGLHLYPSLSQSPESTLAVIKQAYQASGERAVWITEWGFNRNAFTTEHTLSRAAAIDGFLSTLAQSDVPLGPNFFYSFSEKPDSGWGLIAADGRLLPEASVIQQWAEKK